VAFCIDRLGSINDRFGGNFGDLLLKEVAERLRRHSESDDMIGYLGGGTFVASEPASATADHGISAALDGALLSEAFSIDGRVIRVSATAGVARYGRDGEEADALVRNAEIALSRARDTRAEFGPDVIVAHSEASDRIALEHKLRRAIDARQFEVHYLPRIETATGKVVCVEALLRLNVGGHDSVAPDELLPALESSGLINPVGQWMLQSAIEDGIRWQALGIGPLRIAVPVSALQIRRRAFTEQCRKLLDRWAVRVKGYGIDLELSEAAFLQDVEGTASKLTELRSAGVRIALDDFGSGYSSLGVLSKLPLDLIKIAGSLIRGLPGDRRSHAIAGSIISLAAAFNLATVAKDVERPEQLAELRKLKCTQCQGSLFGMPARAAELERMLSAWSGGRPLA
jgi:diguanylate cyclase (GGDEF)-like protein